METSIFAGRNSSRKQESLISLKFLFPGSWNSPDLCTWFSLCVFVSSAVKPFVLSGFMRSLSYISSPCFLSSIQLTQPSASLSVPLDVSFSHSLAEKKTHHSWKCQCASIRCAVWTVNIHLVSTETGCQRPSCGIFLQHLGICLQYSTVHIQYTHPGMYNAAV